MCVGGGHEDTIGPGRCLGRLGVSRYRGGANTTYLLVLYPLVALLSGVVVGLFAYQKWVAPGCSVGGGAKIGATGSFVGIFLGACPACIPAIAVLLPLGVNVFLSRVAPIFAGLAVAILLFAIYRMSGFRLVSGQ